MKILRRTIKEIDCYPNPPLYHVSVKVLDKDGEGFLLLDTRDHEKAVKFLNQEAKA